jgi:hypothetical protein
MQKHLLVFMSLAAGWAATVPAADWQPVEGRIMTKWVGQVNPENPLPEYPRPAMVRGEWMNLNGLWDYTIVHKDAVKIEYWDGQILVPFPVESALSGVAKQVGAEKALWYRRNFKIQDEWKNDRILLHFGAIDWESTVWVNGKEVGSHKGGFDPFSLDITEALKPNGTQQIMVRVWDPTNHNNSPLVRGKQVTDPEGIWYTPVTGIWQTVWLEPVPQASIQDLKITPDIDKKQVTIEVAAAGSTDGLSFTAAVNTPTMSASCASTNGTLVLNITDPKLWSPEEPYLYDLTVQLKDADKTIDEVKSYFGMRKIEVKKDDAGINRLFLNNQPVFHFGLLDQGWWPDGLYTAPSDQALRYDVEMTKAWGFNMLRKHVKVEPQRLYYWCDKLGVLVWQDMPSCGFNREAYSAEALKTFDAQWEAEWKAIIDALYDHPSIVMWVPFNEGWGQYDTERITAWTKNYDPTRLVNNASGWTDKGVGDVHDIHNYPNPAMPPLEENRAAVLGEYGGLGMPVQGHLWEQGGNWGYQTYQDMADLEKRYILMTRDLYALKDKGLAAAVYTQTTDVEVEVNGLMTYDREVIKLTPERLAPVNKGYLPPVFTSDLTLFIDSLTIGLAGNNHPQIRYTLDGSQPSEDSTLYTQPFTIQETTTVKARCFWPDGTASLTTEREFEKTAAIAPTEAQIQTQGLNFACYEGRWEVLPDFATLTAVQTGVAKTISTACVDKEEYFALTFTGFLKVPATGVYQFTTRTDDGSKLYVAGREVVDNDGLHGLIEAHGQIALEAGWHPIEVRYFQGGGAADLEVYWQGPGLKRTQITGDVLGR